MKNIIIITGLVVLAADVVLGAVGRIVWNDTTHIKRLNYSPALPIDLYQSTNAAGGHENKFFGARTLYRLGGGPALSEYEQKKLRNEICASNLMYSVAANNAAADIPGSLGVYLHEDRILSVSDTGITGERLDSVLRKLSRENNATKVAIARYYATAMVRNLVLIHAGGITWNSLDLRNFYTRPNGGLYAVDFSEAKLAAAGTQDAEFRDFGTRVLRDMYMILFPNPGEAMLAYRNFAGAAPLTVAWNQAITIARLNAVVAGANQNESLLTSGLNNNFAANAVAYLTQPQNIPATASLAFPSIVKADHDAAPANQMFYDDAGVGASINLIPGIAAGANKAALCGGWTGNE